MTEPRRRPADARQRAWRFGWQAETLCALALRLKGYRILARRFRGPGGEIDIVARRGATLAIIEVKARPSRGAALNALSPRQRARVERAALGFLAKMPQAGGPGGVGTIRFDVMLVRPWRWPSHIENAWQVADTRRTLG